jgi:hypothetical protein
MPIDGTIRERKILITGKDYLVNIIQIGREERKAYMLQEDNQMQEQILIESLGKTYENETENAFCAETRPGLRFTILFLGSIQKQVDLIQ